MSRLTTKISNNCYAINGDEEQYLIKGYVAFGDEINKLGQCEDIEEEYAKLGIALIPFLQVTLCKIKNETLYMASSDLEKTLYKELELTKEELEQ